MMNALSQTTFEDLSLKPPLQEIFNLQRQHVIKPHSRLVQHTNAHKSTNESVTLKEALGVLIIKLEELTSGTTNFGEGQGNSPDLTFVAEAVLAGKLSFHQLMPVCYETGKEMVP